MTNKIRVTVWNEGRHEKTSDKVKKIYPDGMHAVIARGLSAARAWENFLFPPPATISRPLRLSSRPKPAGLRRYVLIFGPQRVSPKP